MHVTKNPMSIPLHDGDTFLWIGPQGAADIKWDDMRQRGISTIFYQTEPTKSCWLHGPDELWDYSISNTRYCRQQLPLMKVRYAPIGHYKRTPVVDYSSQKLANVTVFFGVKQYRPPSCWSKFSHLQFIQDVWGDVKLETLLKKRFLFLNVHKDCGNPQNPVAIRIPMLIQSKGIVVSELVDSEDQSMFEGMLDFATDPQSKLTEWQSRPTLDARKASEERLAFFAEKFNIPRMFQSLIAEKRPASKIVFTVATSMENALLISSAMQVCVGCKLVVFSPTAFKGPFKNIVVPSLNKWNAQQKRYSLYLKYLKAHDSVVFDTIVTSDMDVFLQEDLPTFASWSLAPSIENTAYTLKSEGSQGNIKWLTALHDETAVKKMEDRHVSCPGFTMGGNSAMRLYISKMRDEIERVAGPNLQTTLRQKLPSWNLFRGLDQGVHNFLLHNNISNITVSLANVMTGDGMRIGRDFQVKNGKVFNLGNQPYLAVHQCNRVQGLCDFAVRHDPSKMF